MGEDKAEVSVASERAGGADPPDGTVPRALNLLSAPGAQARI